jgi:hypothetical protein
MILVAVPLREFDYLIRPIWTLQVHNLVRDKGLEPLENGA